MPSHSRFNADILFFINNGVLALKPTQTGKFSHLVKLTKSGEERVWVFADYAQPPDANGDEQFNYAMRGVVCGTYKEGSDILFELRRHGHTVESVNFFVPFSNGPKIRLDGEGQVLNLGWSRDELRLARLDLSQLFGKKDELTNPGLGVP